MDKFDIRSAKLVSIIGVILFIFIMVIANAYNYLPEKTDNIPNVNTEINLPADETNSKQEPAQEESSKEIQPISENKSLKIIEPDKKETITQPEIIPLENISENENTEEVQTQVETFDSVLSNARQLTTEKKLVNALSEYKKAISLTQSSTEKALCYEEISTIYALAKKYGTALSYAQKAYNLSPSTNREILLARLYYKTGETDKASERINNVLRRDFSQDR